MIGDAFRIWNSHLVANRVTLEIAIREWFLLLS